MKMQLLIFTLLNFLTIGNCEAQSKLPGILPERTNFSFFQGGGMARSYKKFDIRNRFLNVVELENNQDEPTKWAAEVSQKDLAEFYQVFVKNKFNRIKNDKRKHLVTDAGYTNISITFFDQTRFEVNAGMNHPLSGENLNRYGEVRKAFLELVEKYRKNQKS